MLWRRQYYCATDSTAVSQKYRASTIATTDPISTQHTGLAAGSVTACHFRNNT